MDSASHQAAMIPNTPKWLFDVSFKIDHLQASDSTFEIDHEKSIAYADLVFCWGMVFQSTALGGGYGVTNLRVVD